jgi:hypothetical protein
MKAFIRKYHLPIFFTGWLLVNLVQAAGTGLFDDEAYYWIYSLFPAWGYFDHPPAIAMLIKAGYTIFPNELGLRLFIVLLNSASIYLIYQLCDKKKPALFYCTLYSAGTNRWNNCCTGYPAALLHIAVLFHLQAVYKNL